MNPVVLTRGFLNAFARLDQTNRNRIHGYLATGHDFDVIGNKFLCIDQTRFLIWQINDEHTVIAARINDTDPLTMLDVIPPSETATFVSEHVFQINPVTGALEFYNQAELQRKMNELAAVA